MPARLPTVRALRALAERHHFDLVDEELEALRGAMAPTIASLERLERMEQPTLPVEFPRTPGRRATTADDPLGAWYWRCEISGSTIGPLAGRRVGIKDNVCVAGIPMMNGTAVLEGYVPEFDATVVARILRAGGQIVGKTTCEHLCLSGGSHTADNGPVRNPHDPRRSAGGSSGGSAVVLQTRAADLAIGGDQGGSIRIPASFVGVCGLKPTYGLVPCTGTFPLEPTLDHVGPMARTVRDVAVLLDVIAGPDELDPRQHDVRIDRYEASLDEQPDRLRLGVVSEGFGWPGLSHPAVDDLVRSAAGRVAGRNTDIRTVSVPMHRDAPHIFNGIKNEGVARFLLAGNAMGVGWRGHYPVSLGTAFARGVRAHPDDLAPTVKLAALLGAHLHDRYHGRYYAMAQNLIRALAAAYDQALEEVDVLVMPTTPITAPVLPREDAPLSEYLARPMSINTVAFNLSGHPAMSVPCGQLDGLPVGVMLVGRRWEDGTVLRAAQQFEAAGLHDARGGP